jgi:hypothetical protein
MEEYNETINFDPIKRKMHIVNLRVTPDRYKSLPDYLKKYCNTNVSTIKNVPRINGCGANHGICTTCGKGTNEKRMHKERESKKKYDAYF